MNKWVMIDPFYGVCYELNGEPSSKEEMDKAFTDKGFKTELIPRVLSISFVLLMMQ